MNEKELIGKPLVSMEEGAKVGNVRDMVFEGVQLLGLIIKGEHGEGFLPVKSLGGVGPDAITIESYKTVDWNAGKLAPERRTLQELRKLTVVDGTGHEIGKVHDVILDSVGNIQQINVRTEGVFGIGAQHTEVPASLIRAFGPSLITVDAPVASQPS